MTRRSTDFIVVHCSATPPSMDIGFREIDRWHRSRGWRMCGYHIIIRRDGTVEDGRELSMSGAHARGYNSKSVGLCMIGGVGDDRVTPEDNFTDDQWTVLHRQLVALKGIYPQARIIGHNEISSKACPSFDVQQWLSINSLTNATEVPRDSADELVNELDQHGWIRGSTSKASEHIRNNWEIAKK